MHTHIQRDIERGQDTYLRHESEIENSESAVWRPHHVAWVRVGVEEATFQELFVCVCVCAFVCMHAFLCTNMRVSVEDARV